MEHSQTTPTSAAAATVAGYRPLVSRISETVVPRVCDAFATVLQRADDTLFDMAQSTRTASEEQGYMEAMRVLRRDRARVEDRFQAHLREVMGLFASGDICGAERYIGTDEGASGLSLVSEEDLELQLTTRMLAVTLHKESNAVLSQLDRRLSVIGGTEIDESNNPIGPAHIAAAVNLALRPCDVEMASRLILFKLCERELPGVLVEAYDQANRMLAQAGVLVALPPIAVRRSGGAAATARAPAAAAEAPATQRSAADEGRERALFGVVHELLSVYRQSHHLDHYSVPDARHLSPDETMSVLSVLQSNLPPSIDELGGAASAELSLAHRIKRELMSSAGRLGYDPRSTRLAPSDEDAVDLVGMLFDVLLDERDLEGSARALIGRLIVPFIKVALMDRRMFLEKTHPARRLLNSLAEACEGNTGETPHEKALMSKVEEVVNRLQAEFNEDLAIFQTLEEEFRAFLDQHRRRVELAERRTAEAQRGRERLEEARARASSELAKRVGARELSPMLDLILRRYWTHHLSLVLLREGEGATRFTEALACADALVDGFDATSTDVAALDGYLDGYRDQLLPVLASSGSVGESAEECVRALNEELRRLARGEKTLGEAAVAAAVVETPAPVIEAPREEEDAGLKLVSDRDALDFDPADADRVRQLPIGTWVEFISEEGEAQPAKYSWISPISNRLLFVNRRGVRVCVASCEELAAMMRAGRLAIRPVNTAFEHAMQQVLGRLKSGAESAAKGAG